MKGVSEQVSKANGKERVSEAQGQNISTQVVHIPMQASSISKEHSASSKAKGKEQSVVATTKKTPIAERLNVEVNGSTLGTSNSFSVLSYEH